MLPAEFEPLPPRALTAFPMSRHVATAEAVLRGLETILGLIEAEYIALESDPDAVFDQTRVGHLLRLAVIVSRATADDFSGVMDRVRDDCRGTP
jgi:hypothetical protein